MKTREIDVWWNSKNNYCIPQKENVTADFTNDGYVSAKLILPADPEVIEFEIDGGVFNTPGIKEVLKDNPIIQKLAGRRWHCTFREIV
jgi:hypothetical protein